MNPMSQTSASEAELEHDGVSVSADHEGSYEYEEYEPATAPIDWASTSGVDTSGVDIERELQQVLALITLAEREQELERTNRFRSSVSLFLLFVGFLASWAVWWVSLTSSGGSPERAVLLILALALALAAGVALGRSLGFKRVADKHRHAAAEVGETIREVVTTTDWKTRLEPLEWAHLRIRIVQLELFDLSSPR